MEETIITIPEALQRTRRSCALMRLGAAGAMSLAAVIANSKPPESGFRWCSK